MNYKSLFQKVIPIVLAALTAISVVASSVKIDSKDYTVDGIETIEREKSTEESSETSSKKNTIEVGTTEQLAESTTSADNAQGSVSVDQVTENQTYKNGVYTGSAEGYRGTITVKVTIKDGKISKIDVVSYSDDESFFSRAKTLLSKIISGQTTNVDVVSGASYSSRGLINAVRNALSKAKTSSSTKTDTDKTTSTTAQKESTTKTKPEMQPVDESDATYKDGTYYGEGEGFGGTTKVKVVISNGKISSVTVVSHEDDESYFKKASVLFSKIVKQQSTNLDAISGATYSSAGIIEATRNALKKAKIKQDSSDTDNTATTTESTATTETTESTETTETTESTESSEDDTTTTVYTDGTYAVSVPCEPDEYDDFDDYQISMSVTILNDRITTISDVKGIPSDSINKSFINMAVKKLVPSITSSGTTDGIDVVSGATCSSKSIIEGCKAAFDQAKK